MKNRLYAVYLGGKCAGASIEVHDFVFVVGTAIEATLPRLKEVWFGSKSSVHIDSWAELTNVDGHRVEIRDEPSMGASRLYFVNIGFYSSGQMGEDHRFFFLVGENTQTVKARALKLVTSGQAKHADNLIDIDSLIEITEVGGQFVHLEPTTESRPLEIHNKFWPLKA